MLSLGTHGSRSTLGKFRDSAVWESQRASVPKPRVARHELPWVIVPRWFGNGRPNTFERSYAMTSPMEYFAQNTEAFFSRDDFFPFTREELKRHDPEMEQLLARLWGVTK